MEKIIPKHILYDKEKFVNERAKLGQLIIEGMRTTGGTDIDWVVEHRGGFIVMENKTFSKDWLNLPVGQIITFEEMYKKLNSDGRCHFFIFGFDPDVDFKNQDSEIWYFDFKDWKNGKICPNRKITYKKYHVNRREMTKITIREYRKLMEKYWKEFELKPKPQESSLKISQKEKAISDAKKFLLKNFQKYPRKELLFLTRERIIAYHHLGEQRSENYLKTVLSDLKVKHDFDLDENPPKKEVQKVYTYKAIRKKYSMAYEPWTKPADETLKKFWTDKSNHQSRDTKVRELMKKFGRTRGAIVSRLKKIGLEKMI